VPAHPASGLCPPPHWLRGFTWPLLGRAVCCRPTRGPQSTPQPGGGRNGAPGVECAERRYGTGDKSHFPDSTGDEVSASSDSDAPRIGVAGTGGGGTGRADEGRTPTQEVPRGVPMDLHALVQTLLELLTLERTAATALAEYERWREARLRALRDHDSRSEGDCGWAEQHSVSAHAREASALRLVARACAWCFRTSRILSTTGAAALRG
jgi:hypothetical protein